MRFNKLFSHWRNSGLSDDAVLTESLLTDEFASADLELLADQLRQDADYLAMRYPACVPERLPTVSLARRFAPALWSSAAAALLLVATGVWGVASGTIELIDPPAPVRPHPATQRLTLQDRRPSPVKRELPRSMPATFFHDLTGPEKEAVLDLFEERKLVHPSLSI